MNENKRFEAHIFDDGVNERYHDGIIDNEDDENVIRNYQYINSLLNKLHNEKEQLKRINKGQELEIVRLHKLADAMSGALRELGVYNIYDKQQIENRKKENEELKEERDYFERKKCDYQKRISILTTDKIQLKQENEQLKTQIKIFEKFLDENNLDIDWEIFCTVDECKKDSDDYGCKECKYLGVM